MSLQYGERLGAFLAEPLPVTLATTRTDGTGKLAPVWYEYRDGLIWLNGGPKRWFRHMQRDPRATLLVVDGIAFDSGGMAGATVDVKPHRCGGRQAIRTVHHIGDSPIDKQRTAATDPPAEINPATLKTAPDKAPVEQAGVLRHYEADAL